MTSPAGKIRASNRRANSPRVAPHVRFYRVVSRTVQAFFDDNITRLGAALAFYTTVAVAPLMVLAIAAAGFLFDESTARERVLGEIQHLAGTPASAAIESVQSPVKSGTGIVATALSTATLLFGAFGVFSHLQDALNSIWRVQAPVGTGWAWWLKRRLFSLATVLVTGFLLLVSLVASAALSWVGANMMGRFELPVVVLQVVNLALSFAVITFLFALIFRLLPDRTIPWRHVWFGAAVTAFLFTVGKSVLGVYLGHASLASAYGAAGSLVVLLLWSYYAAQIVFLGAEFTRVATLSRGGRDFSQLDTPTEQVRTP